MPSRTLRVQVADQVLMRNISQVDTYCLRATGGAVTVTLAWADYPCDLSAAICLVRRQRISVPAHDVHGMRAQST